MKAQTPDPRSGIDQTAEFLELVAQMTVAQKHFLYVCLEDLDEGRCTFGEALAKIETEFPKVTATPAVGLCKGSTGGSELAAKIRQYLAQMNLFDNAVGMELTDDELDVLAEATYRRTLDEMADMPVRTREDALAVLDLLLAEDGIAIWRPGQSFAKRLRDWLAA